MSMTTLRNSTGVNRLKNLFKQTADATGVSHTSIKRIKKEKVDTGGSVFSILSIPFL